MVSFVEDCGLILSNDCTMISNGQTIKAQAVDRVNIELTSQEMEFLREVNDPNLRQHLLARLEQLGLLAAFLEAENGTTG